MTCLLTVGIPRRAGYVRTVLSQLGIPALELDCIQDGLARGVRVFWWRGPDALLRADATNSTSFALLTDHAGLGPLLGVAATEWRAALMFELPSPAPVQPRSFYVRLPAWGLPRTGFGCCLDGQANPLAGTGLIVGESLAGLRAATQPAGAARIHVTSLPWNMHDMQLGQGWGYRVYYSRTGGKHFVQIGAGFDSGAMRRLLFELIAGSFHALGLPLARLSPFLHGRRHFSVRIDADGFSPGSTAAVLGIARTLGARFTWFIDVGGWARHLGAVRDLVAGGQDVQLHCYVHGTYRRESINRANIGAGLRALARQGVQARAIVSPCGLNFDGFRAALRRFGFRYSSEFGFATDDLPTYPCNDAAYPLQVPISPLQKSLDRLS